MFVDSPLHQLLPEKQAPIKTNAQIESEESKRENFFGVSIFRGSVERKESGIGSGGGGGSGGSSSGNGSGGGSKIALGAIAKKVSPIKRIKGKLSATVANWRKRRDKVGWWDCHKDFKDGV